MRSRARRLLLACLAATAAATLPAGVSAATLAIQPDRVPGGTQVHATLLLDEPPRATTSFPVAFTGAPAQVPASVTVEAGVAKGAFAFVPGVVAEPRILDITVTDPITRGPLASARLFVLPPSLVSIALDRGSVVGGTTGSAVAGTVTLNGVAPPPGVIVTLFQTCASCPGGGPLLDGLPTSVTIPAGTRTATFTSQPRAVPRRRDVTVGAIANAVTKTAALAVDTLHPISVVVSPGTVSGSQPTTVSFTLNAPAYGQYTVAIACSHAMRILDPAADRGSCEPPTPLSDARVPVAEGQSTGSIELHPRPVPAPQQVTIQVQAGGLNDDQGAQTVLTVLP